MDRPAKVDEPSSKRTPPAAKARPARTFTEFVHARRTKRDPFRPPDSKLWSRSVAESCGVPLPKLYGLFEGPKKVSLADLPDGVVVKPVSLTDRRGVFLLERQGERYFDRVSKAHLTQDEIVAQLRKLFEQFPRRSTTIIAEELIETETLIPIDYKFFVFGTDILMIEHINRNDNRKRVLFYDGDFRRMDVDGKIKVNFQRMELDRPRAPGCRDEMLETVRTLARQLGTPFTRIDMYAARRGPILGEITPTPGGAYFGSFYRLSDSFDAHLGREWARAAEALGQPVPQITGRAPIRQRVREKISIGALELRDLKSDLKQLELQRQSDVASARGLEQRLIEIEGSLSWRITRPLRGLARLLSALGLRRPGPRSRE